MTPRDAILRSLPVYAARPGGAPSDIRAGLAMAGVPAALAAEVVEFLPVALARAMLDGMGVTFADHYVRLTSGGRVIGTKPLTDEPVYREGLAIAGEVSLSGDAAFQAVAALSPEYAAVRRALKAGIRPEAVVCPPPAVYADFGDGRAFDDTTGGRQPRDEARPWWRFWK